MPVVGGVRERDCTVLLESKIPIGMAAVPIGSKCHIDFTRKKSLRRNAWNETGRSDSVLDGLRHAPAVLDCPYGPPAMIGSSHTNSERRDACLRPRGRITIKLENDRPAQSAAHSSAKRVRHRQNIAG